MSALLMSLRAETEMQPKDCDRLVLEVTSLRGLLHMALLEYESAGADLDLCAALDRHHVPSIQRRARLYLKTKRPREAIAEMQLLYTVQPEGKYLGY
jgi:hypothetical protein